MWGGGGGGVCVWGKVCESMDKMFVHGCIKDWGSFTLPSLPYSGDN